MARVAGELLASQIVVHVYLEFREDLRRIENSATVNYVPDPQLAKRKKFPLALNQCLQSSELWTL